jgi:hypothetical protein
MEAVIHIGTEKTGTTTVQESLVLNESELNEHQIHISNSSGLPNNRSLVAYAMNYNKTDDFFCHREIHSKEAKSNFDELFIKNIHNELSSVLEKAHVVIFSSEHFSSRITSLKEIYKLKELLNKYFSKFTIICYFRPQVELAISHYSTALRIGETRNLDEYVNKECVPTNYYYNYLTILNNWKEVFGKSNVQARNFDKSSLLNYSLLDDFYNTVGLTPLIYKKFIYPEAKNTSLDSSGQYLLMNYNRLDHRIDLTKKNVATCDEVVQMIESVYPGHSPTISPELLEAKINIFQDMNDKLKARWQLNYLNILNNKSRQENSKIDDKSLEIFLRLTEKHSQSQVVGEIKSINSFKETIKKFFKRVYKI